MGWIKQPNGTGRDDKGHICSAGFMKNLEAKGYLAADGLMSDAALPNGMAFLPLENGATCIADPITAPFRWVAGDAQLVYELYTLWQSAVKPAA